MTDLESSGPVVWPKWCYSNGLTDSVELPSGLSLTPAVKQRRRKRTPDRAGELVKREAATPDRSPSGSPRSLASQRSSSERHSPATPASMASVAATPVTSQPGVGPPQPPRNYSDFMRSLAAKYNNNSSTHSEYFSGQQNGLLRGFDYSRYGLKPGHTPLLPAGSPKEEKKEEPVTAASPLLAMHPHLAALSGLPMLDMLSMVRPGLTPSDYLASSQAAVAAAAAAPTAPAGKRPAEGAPLDLSNMKRPRLDKAGFKELFGLKEEEPRAGSASPRPTAELAAALHGSACTQKPCSTEAEAVAAWDVEQVCAFVRSVDVCAEYAEAFKEHGIDGSTLPLLSAEHLTNILSMKLGPALKLRTALSQKIGHCAVCMHCSHCHATPKTVAKSFLPFSPTSKGH
ncbi:sterile alpha motif domain-containing protein 11-like [Amphibalanus amphitrite]|uniref:sterile alpha motif domain-containing protein 11-like n=1 Tax=Amphibalanus amphitrite TaxID=1232801 RepID=UPI001C911A9A|nr:sterile alpha motif domain-containing protein 11-like [Amphibalanus amphitrite]